MNTPLNRTLLLAFVLFTEVLCAQSIDLNTVRSEFSSAVKSEEICAKNFKWLSKNANSVPTKGYEAVYKMIMAKHTSNPFKKMSHFKAGKRDLEDLIKENSTNTELRFIRFVIQAHIPKYLGYNAEMEADKDFLVQNLSKVTDKKTHKLLYTYLKGTNLFSIEELSLMD
ncbi:hypothetical protein J5U18_12020 [Sphingobacteriaceae bacterium WQ 2009]|uniref:Uncharacterized protein n=1 Tax=Rhinopithecimicrobium faecis TaxID=2820698 RepID=A0A8T4HBG6_9SPHI|nr:hypothetical protein [Sphingobacteriaceae bacterium WQ 2009]